MKRCKENIHEQEGIVVTVTCLWLGWGRGEEASGTHTHTHTHTAKYFVSVLKMCSDRRSKCIHSRAIVSERGVMLSCLLEVSLAATMPCCTVLGSSGSKLSGNYYAYVCVWTWISQLVQPKVLYTCMQVHVGMTDGLNDKCHCTVQLCCLCVMCIWMWSEHVWTH